jgi:hypothetical protein
MAVPVGGVAIDLEANAAEYVTELERAARSTLSASQQMQRGLDQAGRGFTTLDRQAAITSRGVVRSATQMRAGFQQFGFQVQDIAVQLQAGQDPLRVFIQQGSQIAGAFGPVPALIAGVTAAVIGGAAAWLGYSRDVGEAAVGSHAQRRLRRPVEAAT